MTTTVSVTNQGLLPYVPRLLLTWSPTDGDGRHMRVEGTLAFVDISGFTQLTERLARKGKVGAEEMSDILSATFAGLLTEAEADGADLVKWGGDAVLLLFQGPDHAPRAARSAYRMRQTLRTIGRLSTASGSVTLRMSVGVHSGEFDFFLVGDPAIHRELLISGPGASMTADMEAAAAAGQIGLTDAAAALVPPRLLGLPLEGGRLLRSQPVLDDVIQLPRQGAAIAPDDVLPPPIRAHLLSGAVEPEHRPITVAFVQFSGTDHLLRSEGAHALAEALDECVRNVQHACADNAVTFFETDINRDGGKIMLTAGAPRSAGNDEERMLRVARQVMDRAGRLPIRIGVNRGHVFTGDFGPSFRRTYSVKGDAVNLAARVMGKAEPGQVLATLDVVRRSRTEFRTVDLPPFTVKGKSMPILAADIGPVLGARRQERMDVPLIGRAAEMAVLQAALDGVRLRGGGLVEVVGEAGIGKTRLLEELLAGEAEATVVAVACQEYESSTAYFPFRLLLREVLGIPTTADTAEVAQRLVDRVSFNAPDLVPWLPLLGVPMDLRLPPTQETEELEEQFRKGRLEEVVCEFLTWVLPTPTVLVLEDAHLLDDASADLLRRLASQLDRSPWLFLVTRRDGPDGFVPGPSPLLTTVRPAPLDAAAALELVQTALEDRPLPQQAMDILAARSGGNPMFLEALVLEAGRSGSVADLPESVEGLVTSQIDRLAPADRTVLRYAAVLGQVVDEDALLSLLDDHAERPRAGALGRLSDFLVQERAGPLRFRHALMRDVAYEGLPFSRRRTLHDHVGTTIERAAPDPVQQCELLSLHFFHAGRYDRAWTYSVLAGERALAKYANGEAADFFSRAVETARRFDDVPETRLAQVFESLGDARFVMGQPHEAVQAYRQARKHIQGQAVRAAGITLKEARIDQRLGRYPQSLRRLTRGLAALRSDDSIEARAARSRLAARYTMTRFTQGRYAEALSWGAVAARDAEDSADKAALADAYVALHLVYLYSGRTEELPYGRLALQAFEELGQLSGQANCLTNFAVKAVMEGSWTEALSVFGEAADRYRRIGDTANQANVAYNQGDVLIRQGRVAEAEVLLREALRTARAVDDQELVALVLRESGRASARAGRFEEGLARFEEARARFTELGEPQELIDTDVARAECLQLQGTWQEALDLAADTLERASAVGAQTLLPTIHRIRGFALIEAGRLDEARGELETGLAMSDAPSSRHERGFVLLGLAEVAAQQGDPGAADTARESAQVLAALGVVATPTPADCRPGYQAPRRS
jgi:class 3 adenylate cyclase/tetratricopeptide (TPR) repeat protein